MEHVLFVCNHNAGVEAQVRDLSDDVAVGGHVQAVAHRRTRECLVAETCKELAPS